jgi:hypothetical protein
MSVLFACICQFAERFAVAHRGGKLPAEADRVNSRRADEPNQLFATCSDQARFPTCENLVENTACFFCTDARVSFS